MIVDIKEASAYNNLDEAIEAYENAEEL